MKRPKVITIESREEMKGKWVGGKGHSQFQAGEEGADVSVALPMVPLANGTAVGAHLAAGADFHLTWDVFVLVAVQAHYSVAEADHPTELTCLCRGEIERKVCMMIPSLVLSLIRLLNVSCA